MKPDKIYDKLLVQMQTIKILNFNEFFYYFSKLELLGMYHGHWLENLVIDTNLEARRIKNMRMACRLMHWPAH